MFALCLLPSSLRNSGNIHQNNTHQPVNSSPTWLTNYSMVKPPLEILWFGKSVWCVIKLPLVKKRVTIASMGKARINHFSQLITYLDHIYIHIYMLFICTSESKCISTISYLQTHLIALTNGGPTCKGQLLIWIKHYWSYIINFVNFNILFNLVNPIMNSIPSA